ncbi:MAG: S8/S53 family peptidase [Flavipsychrobacter sp.]
MRWCWVLCFLTVVLCGEATAQTQYAFRISFTDKVGAPSTSNPLVFLSQRALDRRTAQGIAVDSIDRPVSPTYIDSVLKLTSGKRHVVSKWLNTFVVLLNDSSKILNLQGKTFIKEVKYIAFFPSGLHKPSGDNSKHEEQGTLSKATGTAAYYGATYDQTKALNGDYLHDLGYKGEDMLIAVFDEGFRHVDTGPAFDSMMKSGRLVDQHNFVLDNNTVFDYSTHGTYSLSAIAGNLPGIYVGSAPRAKFAIYCTEHGSTEQPIELDNLVAALERSDSVGADVVSISLGYNEFFTPVPYTIDYATELDGKTTVAAKGVNIATSRGMLIVPSAGNEGNNSWKYILTPGDADSALTVGNVNINKQPASASGYGPNAAGTIKPNVCVVGQPAALMLSNTTPASISGTSFATPQLAGWAACLIQSTKDPTPYKIRTAIEKSAHIYTTPGAQLGYGVPDFRKAFNFLHVDSPIAASSDWLQVGPNPFTNTLDIRLLQSFNGQLDILLTDATGKVVYQLNSKAFQGSQKITLDLPELSRGVYFLKVITDSDERSVKLVKR